MPLLPTLAAQFESSEHIHQPLHHSLQNHSSGEELCKYITHRRGYLYKSLSRREGLCKLKTWSNQQAPKVQGAFFTFKMLNQSEKLSHTSFKYYNCSPLKSHICAKCRFWLIYNCIFVKTNNRRHEYKLILMNCIIIIYIAIILYKYKLLFYMCYIIAYGTRL